MDKNKTYTAKVTDYPQTEVVVDKSTGEVVKVTERIAERTIEVPVMEDYVDVKLPKKYRYNNGGFVTVFQKAILNIAMFGKLSKGELQLLLYLIGTCGMGNSICIDLPKLAADLGVKKSNISLALKGLVERNIVIRKDGYRFHKTPLPFELHLNFDQINYDLAYNGKVKEFSNKHYTHPQLMNADGETPLIQDTQDDLPQIEE